MPFKSKVQMEKIAELVKQNKFSKEKFDEWLSETDLKKLPERVEKKR